MNCIAENQKLIAIAEWLGWTGLRTGIYGIGAPERRPWPYGFPPDRKTLSRVPNWTSDLNLIHEIEKKLNDTQREEYLLALLRLAWNNKPDSYVHWSDNAGITTFSPASHKIEAILRCLGLFDKIIHT